MPDSTMKAGPPDPPEPHDPRVPDGAVAFTFTCASCGGFAMRVMASMLADAGRKRFNPIVERAAWVTAQTAIGELSTPIGELANSPEPGALLRAIEDGDAEALRRMDREIVPLWCFRCRTAYCATHWHAVPNYEPDTGYFDEMRGTCPEGHDQKLWD